MMAPTLDVPANWYQEYLQLPLSITLTEPVHTKVIGKVLADGVMAKSTNTSLTELRDQFSSPDTYQTVTYKRVESHGRYYTQQRCSTTMPGLIRGDYLDGDNHGSTSDIDAVKCHPSLLLWLVRDLGSVIPKDYEHLESFIKDPNPYYLSFNLTKDEIHRYMLINDKPATNLQIGKHACNLLIFGGGKQALKDEIGFNRNLPKGSKVLAWHQQILNLREIVVKHPKYQELIENATATKTQQKREHPNRPQKRLHDGMRLSWILQTFETYLVSKYMAMFNSISPGNIITYEYDGFNVSLDNNTTRDILDHISKQYPKFPLKFIVKPRKYYDPVAFDELVALRNAEPVADDEVTGEQEDDEDNADNDTVTQFNEKHFKVMEPVSYAEIRDNGDLVIRTASEMKEAYLHIKVPKKKGARGADPSIANVWMNSPNIRTYQMIRSIPPGIPCPADVYNSWKPFTGSIKPDNFVYDQKAVDAIMTLFDAYAGGVPECIKQLEQWTGHLIQRPHQKMGICLILKGSGGDGKSTFFKILRAILGEHHSVDTDNPNEHIFGTYNALFTDKYLINIEESTSKKSEAINVSRFKSLILCDTVKRREMHCSPVEIPSYHTFLFCTNDIAPLDIDEALLRRLCQMWVSPKLKSNQALWSYINDNLLTDPNAIHSIYQYFSSIELLPLQQLRIYLGTAFSNSQKYIVDESEPLYLRWIKDFIYHWSDSVGTSFKAKDLFNNHYKSWCVSVGREQYVGTVMSFQKHYLQYLLNQYPQAISTQPGRNHSLDYVIDIVQFRSIFDQSARPDLSIPLV